jgi:hypothetical protein
MDAMMDENGIGVLPPGRQRKRRTRRPKTGGSGAAKSNTSADSGRTGRSPRGSAKGSSEPGAETVLIELSKAQVDQVVRTAGQGGAMSVLLSSLRDPKWTLGLESDEWAYPAQMDDRRLSRSLLSGLLVLSCFPPEGGYLGIAELARMLDMNTSTTHRYVTTLLAVGLLERDPSTRRYRLATG